MNKNTFNHDRFNTWEKCKKRYYFKYIKELKLPEPEDNYELGKSIHALADYYLRGLKVDHLLKNAGEDINRHWESIKASPMMKNEIIATEWSFNSKIGSSSYWLNGRIDAIFYDKEHKKYIIVDWKTGQNIPQEPENSFQSMIYLYALFNGHRDLKIRLKQEDLAFQYIKTPKLDNPPPIVYSIEKEKQYEEIFIKRIKEIESEKDFPTANPCLLHKYCQYKSFCSR